ncbi:uncharacterized protein LOC142345647 [Convolutriloba macropyga]|uniref:uncharacterized protein LOC142345647 n=1 Tax=Convolutriloba macropyga TaxID=536237 RepID=UPI003F51ACC5
MSKLVKKITKTQSKNLYQNKDEGNAETSELKIESAISQLRDESQEEPKGKPAEVFQEQIPREPGFRVEKIEQNSQGSAVDQVKQETEVESKLTKLKGGSVISFDEAAFRAKLRDGMKNTVLKQVKKESTKESKSETKRIVSYGTIDESDPKVTQNVTGSIITSTYVIDEPEQRNSSYLVSSKSGTDLSGTSEGIKTFVVTQSMNESGKAMNEQTAQMLSKAISSESASNFTENPESIDIGRESGKDFSTASEGLKTYVVTKSIHEDGTGTNDQSSQLESFGASGESSANVITTRKIIKTSTMSDAGQSNRRSMTITDRRYVSKSEDDSDMDFLEAREGIQTLMVGQIGQSSEQKSISTITGQSFQNSGEPIVITQKMREQMTTSGFSGGESRDATSHEIWQDYEKNPLVSSRTSSTTTRTVVVSNSVSGREVEESIEGKTEQKELKIFNQLPAEKESLSSNQTGTIQQEKSGNTELIEPNDRENLGFAFSQNITSKSDVGFSETEEDSQSSVVNLPEEQHRQKPKTANSKGMSLFLKEEAKFRAKVRDGVKNTVLKRVKRDSKKESKSETRQTISTGTTAESKTEVTQSEHEGLTPSISAIDQEEQKTNSDMAPPKAVDDFSITSEQMKASLVTQSINEDEKRTNELTSQPKSTGGISEITSNVTSTNRIMDIGLETGNELSSVSQGMKTTLVMQSTKEGGERKISQSRGIEAFGGSNKTTVTSTIFEPTQSSTLKTTESESEGSSKERKISNVTEVREVRQTSQVIQSGSEGTIEVSSNRKSEQNFPYPISEKPNFVVGKSEQITTSAVSGGESMEKTSDEFGKTDESSILSGLNIGTTRTIDFESVSSQVRKNSRANQVYSPAPTGMSDIKNTTKFEKLTLTSVSNLSQPSEREEINHVNKNLFSSMTVGQFDAKVEDRNKPVSKQSAIEFSGKSSSKIITNDSTATINDSGSKVLETRDRSKAISVETIEENNHVKAASDGDKKLSITTVNKTEIMKSGEVVDNEEMVQPSKNKEEKNGTQEWARSNKILIGSQTELTERTGKEQEIGTSIISQSQNSEETERKNAVNLTSYPELKELDMDFDKTQREEILSRMHKVTENNQKDSNVNGIDSFKIEENLVGTENYEKRSTESDQEKSNLPDFRSLRTEKSEENSIASNGSHFDMKETETFEKISIQAPVPNFEKNGTVTWEEKIRKLEESLKENSSVQGVGATREKGSKDPSEQNATSDDRTKTVENFKKLSVTESKSDNSEKSEEFVKEYSVQVFPLENRTITTDGLKESAVQSFVSENRKGSQVGQKEFSVPKSESDIVKNADGAKKSSPINFSFDFRESKEDSIQESHQGNFSTNDREKSEVSVEELVVEKTSRKDKVIKENAIEEFSVQKSASHDIREAEVYVEELLNTDSILSVNRAKPGDEVKDAAVPTTVLISTVEPQGVIKESVIPRTVLEDKVELVAGYKDTSEQKSSLDESVTTQFDIKEIAVPQTLKGDRVKLDVGLKQKTEPDTSSTETVKTELGVKQSVVSKTYLNDTLKPDVEGQKSAVTKTRMDEIDVSKVAISQLSEARRSLDDGINSEVVVNVPDISMASLTSEIIPEVKEVKVLNVSRTSSIYKVKPEHVVKESDVRKTALDNRTERPEFGFTSSVVPETSVDDKAKVEEFSFKNSTKPKTSLDDNFKPQVGVEKSAKSETSTNDTVKAGVGVKENAAPKALFDDLVELEADVNVSAVAEIPLDDKVKAGVGVENSTKPKVSLDYQNPAKTVQQKAPVSLEKTITDLVETTQDNEQKLNSSVTEGPIRGNIPEENAELTQSVKTDEIEVPIVEAEIATVSSINKELSQESQKESEVPAENFAPDRQPEKIKAKTGFFSFLPWNFFTFSPRDTEKKPDANQNNSNDSNYEKADPMDHSDSERKQKPTQKETTIEIGEGKDETLGKIDVETENPEIADDDEQPTPESQEDWEIVDPKHDDFQPPVSLDLPKVTTQQLPEEVKVKMSVAEKSTENKEQNKIKNGRVNSYGSVDKSNLAPLGNPENLDIFRTDSDHQPPKTTTEDTRIEMEPETGSVKSEVGKMNAEVSRVSDSGLPSYGALDEEAGTSGQGMGDEVVTSLVDIDQEAEGGERTDNEKTDLIDKPGKSGTQILGRTFNLGTEELKTPEFWRAGLGEFMGSFLFLLTCLVPIWSPDSLVASAFGTGLTFTVLVQMFDSVSGGHINPSITLSLLMNGQIPIIKGAMYISVQMLGGVAGSAFVNWSTEDFPKETPGEDVFDRCIPKMIDGYETQGAVFEFLFTSIISMLVLRCNDPAQPVKKGTSALAIGTVVTIANFSLKPITGAPVNPARFVGPAIVGKRWGDFRYYLTSEFSSSIVTPFIYSPLLTQMKTPGSSGFDLSQYNPLKKFMR